MNWNEWKKIQKSFSEAQSTGLARKRDRNRRRFTWLNLERSMLKWIPWSKKRSIWLQFGQWQMTNTEWPHSANTEKQRPNVLDHSAKAFEWNQMSPAASSNQVNVGKINLFIRDMHSVIVIEDYQIINTWL